MILSKERDKFYLFIYFRMIEKKRMQVQTLHFSFFLFLAQIYNIIFQLSFYFLFIRNQFSIALHWIPIYTSFSLLIMWEGFICNGKHQYLGGYIYSKFLFSSFFFFFHFIRLKLWFLKVIFYFESAWCSKTYKFHQIFLLDI